MSIAKKTVQLGALTVATFAALTAATVVPSAQADPDPCSAATLAETISKVNHGISQYLQAHPDTNQALSEVPKQSPFEAQSSFSAYFDAHPQEAGDLHAIQQPLFDLQNQCGYQVSAGEVLVALGDL